MISAPAWPNLMLTPLQNLRPARKLYKRIHLLLVGLLLSLVIFLEGVVLNNEHINAHLMVLNAMKLSHPAAAAIVCAMRDGILAPACPMLTKQRKE